MKIKGSFTIGLLISLFLIAAAEATPPPPIIYVDDDAAGADNGSSWRDAFTNLQTALYVGKAWNVEIHVAQGIYKPSAVEDRNAIFELPGGLPVKGGYAGFSEPDPNARDFNHYATILSGDLAGDDVEVGDPYNLLIEQPKRAENSYNIIKAYGSHDPPIILDGFTIVGALDSCISLSHSNAIITNCTFKNNTSQGNGGVLNSHNSRAIFVRCTFITNAAGSSGGVVCMDGCGTCEDSYAAFHDCRFINNWAAIAGGAVYSVSNTCTTFINCIIAGNTAGTSGGGLYDGGEWGSSLVNCTITTNKAPTGAGICTGGGRWRRTTLNNCILWSNYSDQIDGGGANITFSDIQDGWTDAGNIAADPCFVSPGYWDTNGLWINGDYHLRSDSPCINKGDPNFVAKPSVIECPPGYYFYPLDPKYIAKSSEMDLDSKHRVAGGRVDMGAYEYQTVFYWYVDDNAPDDPGPADPCVSDPLEDGTKDHPYDTIQEAIDTAIDGDTIIVAEGKYFENINFKGKNINLRSTNPNNQDIVAATIIDGNNLGSVVTFAGTENATCVLSGFTIQNGSHDGEYSRGGGGICGGWEENHTRATIRNNIITRNSAWDGGGISCCDGLIEKNIITNNYARWYQGGGGLYECNGLIRNNIIAGNISGGCESASGLSYCNGTILNNTITGNAGGWVGGLAYCHGVIRNCIIWGNSPEQIPWDVILSFNCIQGWGSGGEGNIDTDPCFVEPGYWDTNGVWVNGDYHLKSQAGRWDPISKKWVLDNVTSLCIDMGDPCSPIGLEPFPNGGIINMGAYGGTADASKSYFDVVPISQILYIDDDAYSDPGPGNPDISDPLENGTQAHPFDAIQEAIDKARNRKTIVIVLDGIYTGNSNRDIDFKGRAITVRSEGGPRSCIIDCQGSWKDQHRGFYFYSGEGSDSVLEGFTITNGYALKGGGICCIGSSPTILNSIFIANCAEDGAGLAVQNSGNPVLKNCLFVGNLATEQGGGMDTGAWATLFNCTVANNRALRNGGIGGGVTLTNCIVWDNWPDEIYPSSIVSYSNVKGGSPGQGNINADPCFVKPGYWSDPHHTPSNLLDDVCFDGDYRIQPDSPCIDAGDNMAISPTEIFDLAGNFRFVDDPDTLDTGSGIPPIVDIGAYEVQRHWYVDDNAPSDPSAGDPNISDPLEDGTRAHPFDAIQEAIAIAKNPETVIVLDGTYTGTGNHDIDFKGKAITVRSKNGPKNCIIDCQGSEQHRARGFYFDNWEGENSVVDGFTITNGYHYTGGAIWCYRSSPTIKNNLIINNSIPKYSGGSGGGIFCGFSGPIIINNKIIGNGNGAHGIYSKLSSPKIINNIIADNTGHGILCEDAMALVEVSHNTIIGNTGGVAGPANVTNCILWGNTNEIDPWSVPTYSCIRNWTGDGQGNIDADPCFVDPANGDYHLKSEGWRWDTTRKVWTWDDVTSRCIDASNPGSPLGDEPLTIPVDPNNQWGRNLRIDMGAYGGTAEASMPPYDWALLADLTNNGIVNFVDLADLGEYWLNSNAECPGDFDRNGIVDMVDFALLAEDWLKQTSWYK